jgi:L-arabinokinase
LPALPRAAHGEAAAIARVWAVDSGASHEVSGIEYEAARAAAFMGYKLITMWEHLPVTLDESGAVPRYVEPRWNGYLSNMLPSEYRAEYEWRLPEIMTGPDFIGQAESHIDPFTQLREGVIYRIRNCTRYAVEENARIETFAELARGASIEESEPAFRLMGDLMYHRTGPTPNVGWVRRLAICWLAWYGKKAWRTGFTAPRSPAAARAARWPSWAARMRTTRFAG